MFSVSCRFSGFAVNTFSLLYSMVCALLFVIPNNKTRQQKPVKNFMIAFILWAVCWNWAGKSFWRKNLMHQIYILPYNLPDLIRCANYEAGISVVIWQK